MRAANGSPGSISIHSFRRLSLSVRQLAATERDSDDEFSGEEEEVEDEEVLRNMEDKPIDAGDVPTTSQHPSSFNEKRRRSVVIVDSDDDIDSDDDNDDDAHNDTSAVVDEDNSDAVKQADTIQIEEIQTPYPEHHEEIFYEDIDQTMGDYDAIEKLENMLRRKSEDFREIINSHEQISTDSRPQNMNDEIFDMSRFSVNTGHLSDEIKTTGQATHEIVRAGQAINEDAKAGQTTHDIVRGSQITHEGAGEGQAINEDARAGQATHDTTRGSQITHEAENIEKMRSVLPYIEDEYDSGDDTSDLEHIITAARIATFVGDRSGNRETDMTSMMKSTKELETAQILVDEHDTTGEKQELLGIKGEKLNGSQNEVVGEHKSMRKGSDDVFALKGISQIAKSENMQDLEKEQKTHQQEVLFELKEHQTKNEHHWQPGEYIIHSNRGAAGADIGVDEKEKLPAAGKMPSSSSAGADIGVDEKEKLPAAGKIPSSSSAGADIGVDEKEKLPAAGKIPSLSSEIVPPQSAIQKLFFSTDFPSSYLERHPNSNNDAWVTKIKELPEDEVESLLRRNELEECHSEKEQIGLPGQHVIGTKNEVVRTNTEIDERHGLSAAEITSSSLPLSPHHVITPMPSSVLPFSSPSSEVRKLSVKILSEFWTDHPSHTCPTVEDIASWYWSRYRRHLDNNLINDISMIAYTTPSIISPGVVSPHQLSLKSPSTTSSTPRVETSSSTIDSPVVADSLLGSLQGELVETIKEIKQILVNNSLTNKSANDNNLGDNDTQASRSSNRYNQYSSSVHENIDSMSVRSVDTLSSSRRLKVDDDNIEPLTGSPSSSSIASSAASTSSPSPTTSFLKNFFINFDGDNWKRKDNWEEYIKYKSVTSSDSPEGSIAFSHEDMRRPSGKLHGVEIELSATRNRQLTKLILPNNNIVGTIKPSLFTGIRTLKSLVLNDNDVCGELPSASFSSWRLLTVLFLHSNHISGNIPTNIYELKSLVVLRLENNLLEGAIPEEVCMLTNLERLVLSHNRLTGSLPSQNLSMLKNLQQLAVDHNRISGSIPDGIWTMKSLRTLNLKSNKLRGILRPLDIQNSTMVMLNVEDNKLEIIDRKQFLLVQKSLPKCHIKCSMR